MDKIYEKYYNEHKNNITYDSLTNALSKESLINYSNWLIENNIKFSLYFIDFDDFKKINDFLGHQVGDKALIDCANILSSSISDKGILARYGGDEFTIITPLIDDYDEIWAIARLYTQNVRHSNVNYLDGVFLTHKITLTTGIARYPKDANNFDDLLYIADKALYRGKTKGKNCFIIYDKSLHKNISKEENNITVNPESIINYLFETFERKDDIKDALLFSSSFVAENYRVSAISLLDECNNDINLFKSIKDDTIVYNKIELNEFMKKEDLKYSVIYKSVIKDEYKELYQELSKSLISTMVVVKLEAKDKFYGYLRFDSRRERIWTEQEILVFNTLANIYAMTKFFKE